jgi:predicted nucleotidyltransferase
MSLDVFEEELARVLERLKAYAPQKVILYGSFARGDYHALSDVDLLIVKDTSRPFVQRIGDVLEYVDSPLRIEPMVYTSVELARMQDSGNPFLIGALAEGRVLYERKPAAGQTLV